MFTFTQISIFSSRTYKKPYFEFNDVLIINYQNSLKMNTVCLSIMFLMCTKFYKHTGEGFLKHSRINSLFVSGLLHVQKWIVEYISRKKAMFKVLH